MTTWTQLLADIRLDLKDTTATQPKWSDAALHLYAKDAIRDYSSHFPRRISRLELTPGVDGSYPLPADFLAPVDVECPLDRFLEKRQPRPGTRFRHTALPTLYYTEGGRLHLNGDPPSGDLVLLTYDAFHAIPATPLDTIELTIPPMDEELIRLYVKAKATERERTAQSSLDRFKLGSGGRDDNPLTPEVGNLMVEYRTRIAERIPGRIILLYRPGRMK